MTSTLDTRLAPATDHRPTSPLRRITAIARSEARLLGRNKAAFATGLLMGPMMAGMFVLINLGNEAQLGGSFAGYVVCIVLTWSALMTVYYNLTSIYVTRREDRVFKRLSTGEATQWEALMAAAVPSTLILLAHLVLGAVVAMLAFGIPAITNVVLVLLGVVGVIIVSVGLAAASTAFTSTVEAAQYSTMPVFLVLGMAAGTMFPLTGLPEVVQIIASLTPINAAVDLVHIGLDGATIAGEAAEGFLGSFSAAGFPLLVLAGWCVLAVLLARRYMKFEPRR